MSDCSSFFENALGNRVQQRMLIRLF